MQTKLEFKIEDDDDGSEMDRLKRSIHADEAFGVICGIKEAIRSQLKHGASTVKNLERLLESIQSEICGSGLMEMYN